MKYTPSGEPESPGPLGRRRNCENCGTNYEGGRCPKCGSSSAPSFWESFWVVIFVILGTPALCGGGCLILLAIGPRVGPRPPEGVYWGIGLVALFFVLLYLAFFRRK